MPFLDKLSKIFGDSNKRYISSLDGIVEKINLLEGSFEKIVLEDLPGKTKELRGRIKNGATLDSILPEAFALVREASKRVLNMRHFDVQLIGGIVLHEGKIAEMKTGEGKTLVATLPLYLNALTGKGCHIVTPNDYLSKIGGGWMGPVYHALGVSVGVITHDFSGVYDPGYSDPHDYGDERLSHWRPVLRSEAYATDITYGTNNELGFDYLRDNLVYSKDRMVQRGHHYAIIDEVDSILIDEARTPLIISAPDTESTELYKLFAKIAPKLEKELDYNVDEKMRAATITDDGIDKVEQLLGIKDIYSEGGIKYVHHLEQALRATALFALDKDYVVKSGEVIIVDSFTGRMMPGRRWSDGLHQAIEAKEGVAIQKESRTVASITFQNYFRMYEKLSGMTGTAMTSAEEFHKVYGLEVMSIPTHRPLVRKDLQDRIYQTEEGKLKAVTREIKERNERGQPVLIGTVSIEKNEYLSRFLQKEGIKHQMLNAKNHEYEAQIIAQAGRLGAVTVATNMAGRGVDIILGGSPQNKDDAEKIRTLGGLCVVGTERHEARRIDNQLRGRAGRQGDPGETQFFVSFEDDLMRIFGSDKIKNMMGKLGVPEDEPIENNMVSKALESAQGKIEGFNFDSRKHLLDYDDVMNRQRKSIYEKRRELLFSDDKTIKDMIYEMLGREVRAIADFHLAGDFIDDWDLEEVYENIKARFGVGEEVRGSLLQMRSQKIDSDELRGKIQLYLQNLWEGLLEKRIKEVGESAFIDLMRVYLLQITDTLWTNHLEAMDYLRSSVNLRAYGQRDPLVEYKNEGSKMFREMQAAANMHLSHVVLRVGSNPPIKQEKLVEKHEGAGLIGSDVIKQRANDGEQVSKKHAGVGRNDPCPCGSGKKHKKCHGR